MADVTAAPIDTIDPIAAADAALAIHRRGVATVTSLAAAYGFEARFYWQPYLYTRDARTPAEETLVGLPGYDTDVAPDDRARQGRAHPARRRPERRARRDRGIDLLGFRAHERTGARAVAEAMYTELAPTLREAAGG
ncbi:MAG: hypothetical protein R2695_09985 [Acidimicrobiales bacterium]